MPKKSLPILIAVFFILTFSSCTCIYFNTFHNIRKNFNGAENSRKKDGRDKARGGEVKQYTDAITKASKVLERHPTSSWVDDALYIIGASYYYLEEYDKAARKFKELFANYPNSEYVSRSRLLMSKAKLQLKEEAEAVVLFEEIFEQEQDKSMKADAARALGEYYFETKDYASANKYFTSLIDSLGEETDKIRALLYVADGYYERYRFDKALENYRKGLDHSPDTLQHYRIMFRMAECDFFLNNISGGLEKLENLLEDEQYYDSLTPIRLKMAEGYEWDGNYTDAINVYDKVIVENPGADAAAVSYYNLGLIYQYDFEELEKARGYYQKSLEERRNSTVSEEATRRASKLALLEQYAKTGETEIEADSSGVVDQITLDKMTETQYLLGELFYFDLGKPDSALHAFDVLLERYPRSRYAPRALMSMAYIQRTEFADTAAADSLLRKVLTRYARYDEAEEVIDMLGLAGTRADTGYAAIVFNRAEKFLEQYLELDSSMYYLSLVADSILAADSIRRLDSARVADSGLIIDSSQIFDSLLTEGMEALKDTRPPVIDSTAILDSLRTADSVRVADSIANATGQNRADSIRVADSMRFAEARRVADSIQNAYRRRVIDSAMVTDSIRKADSAKAADQKQAGDTATADSTPEASGPPGPETSGVVDSTPAAKPQIPPGDSTPSEVSGIATDSSEAVDTAFVADTQATAGDTARIPDTTVSVDSLAVSDSLQTQAEPRPADTGVSIPPATAPPLPIEETIVSPIKDDSLSAADSIKVEDSLAVSDTALVFDSLAKPDSLAPGDQLAAPDTAGIVDSLSKSDTLRTGATLPRRDSTKTTPPATQDSSATAAAEPEPELPKIDYWRVAFDSARHHIDPQMYSLLDSAQYLYHMVIDSFPFSNYSIQARYVLLWIYDKYLAPGDSSLIDLYRTFVDSFPATEYAQLIYDNYGIRGAGAQMRRRTDQQQQQQQEEQLPDTGLYAGQELTDEERADSILLASPESKFITDEDGNILEPADKYFLRENLPFQYPMEALAYNIEDKLYFHIRIDFSGEVVELRLINETVSSELNDRIKETVKNTRFDAGRIPPELYDHWFYYTYKVQIPPEMRRR